MKKTIPSVIPLAAMAFSSQVYAQKNPMVGGAAM
jgi:hypothetical protein